MSPPHVPGRPFRQGGRRALLLVTGFPGFLTAALLPRLLALDDAQQAVCLV